VAPSAEHNCNPVTCDVTSDQTWSLVMSQVTGCVNNMCKETSIEKLMLAVK